MERGDEVGAGELDKMKKKFGQWLTNMLLAHGMNQADLARKMGVDRSRVSKWTRGVVMPDTSSARSIADALGMDTAYEVLVHAGHIELGTVESEDPVRNELIRLIWMIPADRLTPYVAVFADLAGEGKRHAKTTR